MATITEREAKQIDEANASGRTAVVFMHGLWLLPSSWDRWREVFEEAGYATLTPSWPDDPETVDEAGRTRSASPTRRWVRSSTTPPS